MISGVQRPQTDNLSVKSTMTYWGKSCQSQVDLGRLEHGLRKKTVF